MNSCVVAVFFSVEHDDAATAKIANSKNLFIELLVLLYRLNSYGGGVYKTESVELISLSGSRFWNTYGQINNTPHSYRSAG